MKKILLLILILLAVACGRKQEEKETSLDYRWGDVVNNSRGAEVNIYMYGGFSEVNKLMDTWVADTLKKENNITLNRVPISDIKDTVNKLIVEKQAGKKDGSVDVIWINGENFKTLKDAGVLWGDFAKGLPAMDKVKGETTVTDFGEPIEGLEAPWGEAQFNFIYDSAKGKLPFTDHESLKEYVVKNPGKFSYPAIPDFTGSAFVRNMVLDILGAESVNKMDNEEFEKALNEVWSYFKEIKPYLWREGATYPEGPGKMDTLYRSGEIDITMDYNVNKVTSKILSGEFKESSRSFLLDRGTLFNNHYFSIPANASNKAGALYVINFLLSEEAQAYKQNPRNWGDFTILDLKKVSEETRKKLQELGEAKETPSMEELSSKRVRELSPEKLEIIEKGWIENIGKY